MDRISALMDGELEPTESRREVQRLESDSELAQGWHTYHLIRDALHDELPLSAGFSSRLHQRLAQEPTVLAPRRLIPPPLARHALPIAASVAGVAVVAWLALSSPVTTTPKAFVAGIESTPALQQAATRPNVPAGSHHAGIPEYLVAHQEFSPSTAMQGVVSYVRTVSNEEPVQNR